MKGVVLRFCCWRMCGAMERKGLRMVFLRFCFEVLGIWWCYLLRWERWGRIRFGWFGWVIFDK